jgi:Replication initiation factor
MSQSALTSKISPVQPQSESHPPSTNRGVETLTQERIHWISFTLKIDSERVWPSDLSAEFTETKSFNGYDTAKEYSDGRIELTSSVRPEMGIHCVLYGSCCDRLADNLPDILECCWMQGGRVTRFDLALDDLKGRVNAIDAREYIKRGEIECRAREYPPAGDIRGGGQSQYCGKMASECHVCIYDKDAEQGISGFRTRIEIRFKGRKADKAAKTYLQSNDCRGLILGFVKFPKWQEWNEVFSTAPIKINSEQIRSRRVLWLLGQVSKSIALEISERGGDLEILSLIHESVMAKLSDLRHDKNEGNAA